jgi:hypothetical protein
MPDTGAPYNLHYPGLNDAANVPTDMQLLAANVVTGLNKVAADFKTADNALKASLPAAIPMKSGTVSIGTVAADSSKSVDITFPAGFFATAPVVVATAVSNTAHARNATVYAVTTTKATIHYGNSGNATISGAVVHWIAMKATP